MCFIENIRDIFFDTTKELNNLNYKNGGTIVPPFLPIQL